MGHHKHNPTAIAAKNGAIEPKPKKLGKRERERLLMREIERATGINRIREQIGRHNDGK
jgi:hypothetical protein